MTAQQNKLRQIKLLLDRTFIYDRALEQYKASAVMYHDFVADLYALVDDIAMASRVEGRSEWWHEQDEEESDGQPDEYTEWQDYMGGDDWDHGQYD